VNLSFGNIFAGLIFSGIGFVAFTYGKREGRFQTMVLGIVLMAYTYVSPSTTVTWVIGGALTLALYFFHD
jgi:hypothetical protein